MIKGSRTQAEVGKVLFLQETHTVFRTLDISRRDPEKN